MLICADRVVTGHRGQVIEDGAVLVHGTRITWVGPARSAPGSRARAAERIHLDGATLLPGLIEGHAHLCLDGGDDPFTRLAQASPRQVAACARTAAERMLAKGITCVRDLGGTGGIDALIRAQVRSGQLIGPRLLSAGVPLTCPGGHCAVFGGQISTGGELARRIGGNHRGGATWTKIMVTGGFSTPASSPHAVQLTASQLATAVRLSRRRGLKVAAHAHGTDGIALAAATGVDTIEHATWMREDGFDVDAAVVAELARRGIGVGVTINSRARAARGRLPWPERVRQLQTMRAAGVRLIAGTDCGISGTAHDDLPASLACYTDAGYRPLEVIELATSGNARALGLATVTGTLAAGYAADLLAVQGNPLESLACLMRTRYVMARGRPVPGAGSG
ncbi:amidohydrolase family protein [Planomonospora parontospora]|uniref:amidohydrolase family protein n=1 Tax=Planomonospora parontospora TaxID=58119 RepID=UPI00166FEE6B|nr:amidohydrolase family protein [Planomonospora parontospora]